MIYTRDSKFTIYMADYERGKFYRLQLTRQQAKLWNNVALVNTGLIVGAGGITAKQFDYLSKFGTAITKDEFEHSGCKSSCKLRGDSKCS
jgi:hypothetical protein